MTDNQEDIRQHKKPVTKRRRRHTKNSCEVKGDNLAMAGSKDVNKAAKEVAASVSSSSVLLPPRFDFPMHFQPPPPPSSYWSQPNVNSSELSSKIDFILSKVQKLDSIETQQANILSRLNNIEKHCR